MKIYPPTRLDALVALPASKSISNRALVIAALAGDCSKIENVAHCDDSDVVVRAIKALADNEGGEHVIDVKAAGTAMRFLTAFLASVPHGEHIITGTERMKQRPISALVDALHVLGADVEYAGEVGFPPLRIVGKELEGGAVSLSGNVSSQYVSALLMVGPMMSKGLELRLTNGVISRPYIDMTIGIMRDFGASVEWRDDETIVVQPGGYAPEKYTIESDWSAASYWYEIVALSDDDDARILLPGLKYKSLQGDKRIADIFAHLGVATEYTDDVVILTKSSVRLDRVDIDMSDMPDLAQTLVVTCCMTGLPFHITGLQTLKIKETDRIVALQTELAKQGFTIQSKHDSELIWTGTRSVPSWQPVDTYDDHRMAMAFAPAALKLGGIEINNPEVVSKSYPEYWEHLAAVGFRVEDYAPESQIP